MNWTSVEGIFGAIITLVVHNDTVFVGGYFENSIRSGLYSYNIGLWNPKSGWDVIGIGLPNSPEGSMYPAFVNSLSVHDDILYVCGNFEKVSIF